MAIYSFAQVVLDDLLHRPGHKFKISIVGHLKLDLIPNIRE